MDLGEGLPTNPWPPPTGAPSIPTAEPQPRQQRRRSPTVLAAGALFVAAITATTAFTGGREHLPDFLSVRSSVERDYDNLLTKASERAAAAESVEASYWIDQPDSFFGETERVDRASARAAVDVWSSAQPRSIDSRPDLTFVYDGDVTYIHTDEFDKDGDGSERWFLMEDAPVRESASRESVFTGAVEFLEDLDDATPSLVGEELVDSELLVRYDLAVPAEQFLQDWEVEFAGTLDIDLEIDVTIAVWFAPEGDVRRVLLDQEANGRAIRMEVRSRTFADPLEIGIPDPAIVESFNDLKASRDAD